MYYGVCQRSSRQAYCCRCAWDCWRTRARLGWPQKGALELTYLVVGLALFHLLSVLTLAILCLIIVLMKGHGYVADAYPLPDRDRPRQ